MIAWADAHFQHYLLKQGDKPKKKYGIAYAKHTFLSSMKHVLAYIIGASFLAIIIGLIDDPSRTGALSDIMKFWGVILVLDIFFSLSYFIWPRQEKKKTTIF